MAMGAARKRRPCSCRLGCCSLSGDLGAPGANEPRPQQRLGILTANQPGAVVARVPKDGDVERPQSPSQRAFWRAATRCQLSERNELLSVRVSHGASFLRPRRAVTGRYRAIVAALL